MGSSSVPLEVETWKYLGMMFEGDLSRNVLHDLGFEAPKPKAPNSTPQQTNEGFENNNAELESEEDFFKQLENVCFYSDIVFSFSLTIRTSSQYLHLPSQYCLRLLVSQTCLILLMKLTLQLLLP